MTITEYETTETALEVPVEAGPAQMAPEIYHRLPVGILTDGPTSGDHKVIGRLWIFGALLFGLFAVVADILVKFERIDTEALNLFSSAGVFEQWFTLQRVSFVFLFVVPLLIGIATIMVPLQIGAPSVAFPRAAAAALWTWVVAGVMLVVSWAIDGGFVDKGFDTVSSASQLSMVAFAAVALSIIVATMVIVTTIFTERSAGMTLYNLPMFSWSMLVAGALWLLTLPVLVANLMVMWVDARGDGFQKFGGVDQYDQVSWMFDQPQVFAFAIPVLGMIAELVPVAVRRRLKNYDMAMVAIGAFGAFTFGAYAQSFFNPNSGTSWLYVLGSLTLLVPILALIGSLALTGSAAGRAPQVSSQLGLGVAALLALLLGGALAAVRVLDSVLAPVLRAINWFIDVVGDATGDEWQRNAANEIQLDAAGNRLERNNGAPWIRDLEGWVSDFFDEITQSSLTGAMVQVVMIAGLLAAIAGLFYWAPKIFGARLPAAAGPLIALLLLGGVAASIADAVSGFLDQPDFVAMAAQRGGVEALNVVSLVGSLLVFGAVGLLIITIAGSFFVDDEYDEDEDPGDPWGGHTLEWLTDSPPAPGNFSGPMTVTSEAPLLDDDFVRPTIEASA